MAFVGEFIEGGPLSFHSNAVQAAEHYSISMKNFDLDETTFLHDYMSLCKHHCCTTLYVCIYTFFGSVFLCTFAGIFFGYALKFCTSYTHTDTSLYGSILFDSIHFSSGNGWNAQTNRYNIRIMKKRRKNYIHFILPLHVVVVVAFISFSFLMHAWLSLSVVILDFALFSRMHSLPRVKVYVFRSFIIYCLQMVIFCEPLSLSLSIFLSQSVYVFVLTMKNFYITLIFYLMFQWVNAIQ